VRRVRVTVVVVEKSDNCYEFRVCVCSLSYPACIAHVPHYIVTCALSAHTTFFHIILSYVPYLPIPHFSTLYCHMCPICPYRIFPHYIVICALSAHTAFFHIILSHVPYLPIPQFSTLYCHMCPICPHHNFPHYIVICALSAHTAFFHIILSYVPYLPIPYFSTLCLKWHH